MTQEELAEVACKISSKSKHFMRFFVLLLQDNCSLYIEENNWLEKTRQKSK